MVGSGWKPPTSNNSEIESDNLDCGWYTKTTGASLTLRFNGGMDSDLPAKLGIHACLLGTRVRVYGDIPFHPELIQNTIDGKPDNLTRAPKGDFCEPLMLTSDVLPLGVHVLKLTWTGSQEQYENDDFRVRNFE